MPNPSQLTPRLDHIVGSFLAGAVGDALGAPIEFAPWTAIRAQYGPQGVRGYVPHPENGRLGLITDDTQMTLFTAESLVRAFGPTAGETDPVTALHDGYLRWLRTQDGPRLTEGEHDGWLLDIPELWSWRDPGTTCLTALRTGPVRPAGRDQGQSKGCGAVMRAAPMGVLPRKRFAVALDSALLTHTHPEGYHPAGALAVLTGALIDGADLTAALNETEDILRGEGDAEFTLRAVQAGRERGSHGVPSVESLEGLGGGWVGEEALAIAVACAVGGIGHPVDALLASVNHSGDSDSTGAITGNILGAALGTDWLPQEWVDGLELHKVVVQMAEDLFTVTHGDVADASLARWEQRYPRRPENTPRHHGIEAWHVRPGHNRFVAESEDFRVWGFDGNGNAVLKHGRLPRE